MKISKEERGNYKLKGEKEALEGLHKQMTEKELANSRNQKYIVPIFHTFQLNHRAGYFMPFYRWTMLSAVEREKSIGSSGLFSLSYAQKINIARGLVRGLYVAHSLNYAHNDIKPANLLLTDGLEPRIADWGMSTAASTG